MVMVKVRRTCLAALGLGLCVLLVAWNIGAGVLWPHNCTDLLASRRLEQADVSDYEDVRQQMAKMAVVQQQQQQQGEGGWAKMQCLINDDYYVDCRQDDTNEVYVPFTFIHKYFEIQGHVVTDGDRKYFDWQHSFSNVYYPRGKYTPNGVFMSFEHYNVEVRDRVKCISGVEGVPLSTQWGSQGYFYPIQIAQYGLSHYSKHLLDTSRVSQLLEDAESGTGLSSHWHHAGGSSLRVIRDTDRHSSVLEFNTAESVTSAGVKLDIDSPSLFFLLLHVRLRPNASLTIVVETKPRSAADDTASGGGRLYSVSYVSGSSELVRLDGHNVFYGIGNRADAWSWLVRDVALDLQKALATRPGSGKGRKKVKVEVERLVSLSLHGRGTIDNVTLASSAHYDQFMAAAEWLVAHQDTSGGWPVMVTRKLANDRLELAPGWYSAMAQGQAMSVLVRAFARTSDKRYLRAAFSATRPFDVASADGGVLAKFAEQYPWYEEYPTTPPSFVLNGFIYSLIGLYDLKTIAVPGEEEGSEEGEGEGQDSAARLYSRGLESLKALLPLFDTGSGSIYDLRHFTLGLAPNIARWDYHTTHINQLLLLATIDDSEILRTTSKRWIGYMKGQRAAHN